MGDTTIADEVPEIYDENIKNPHDIIEDSLFICSRIIIAIKSI